MRAGPRRRHDGFTLIELMIVIFIIALMASFILVVSFEGIRRAEERATQALITKLETGVSDRIEALLRTRPEVSSGHVTLSQLSITGLPAQPLNQRAQVIARVDQMRAELPDVFFLQVNPADLTTATGYPDIYPLNFAGRLDPSNGSPYYPLGSARPGSGVLGASYSAAAGIYKNLGYFPAGCDGADNNGNGDIDELREGIVNPSGGGIDTAVLAQITLNLQRHNHKTARSEMLYALLVEGAGPLGSVFNRDDFTTKEVQDTDNDGLPEFVDAWGEPLQFYRWPIFYPSPIQKGAIKLEGADGVDNNFNGTADEPAEATTYPSPLTPRDQNPLDPNQQLVAPAWYSADPGATNNAIWRLPSARAVAFQQLFFSLVDPLASNPTGAELYLWDRGGDYKRRAFFSKFLISSSGPDRAMGIARIDVDYDGDGAPDLPLLRPLDTAANIDQNALNMILIENQAGPFGPNRAAWQVGSVDLRQKIRGGPVNVGIQEAGLDDITNHTIQAPGTGLR